MNSRESEPQFLDVEKLAEQARTLEGRRPLHAFGRLVEVAHPEAPPAPADAVEWRIRGERRVMQGEAAQTWLHLDAHTPLSLTCQRCLQPLPIEVEARRSFRFVESEAAAARLDAESDDDVLATSRALNLFELVEDELLLALPLVPRHADCRMPWPAADAVADLDRLDGAAADEAGAGPFAVLAALRERGTK